jgi:hypothetical protein
MNLYTNSPPGKLADSLNESEANNPADIAEWNRNASVMVHSNNDCCRSAFGFLG